MPKCKHGVYLPKDPKYKAEDVCSICKGLPEDKVTTALMNDDYSSLSIEQLNSILYDPEFDFTIKDNVMAELQSRAFKENAYESE